MIRDSKECEGCKHRSHNVLLWGLPHLARCNKAKDKDGEKRTIFCDLVMEFPQFYTGCGPELQSYEPSNWTKFKKWLSRGKRK